MLRGGAGHCDRPRFPEVDRGLPLLDGWSDRSRVSSDSTTPKAIPCSTPNVSSPAITIRALANEKRLRTNRSCRYLGLVRCSIAAMTMAASAGCGMFRNRGVSQTSVKRQKVAATRLATWLRAPAAVATEVFDRLPTTRKPPKRPLKMFAGPCATNSWFGSMSPPLCIAAAFAAPSASAYPTSTMASAPGASSYNKVASSFGGVRWGSPDGMWPATCTPVASPPRRPIRIVATARTTSAAGMLGARKRNNNIAARARMPVRAGASDTSGRC